MVRISLVYTLTHPDEHYPYISSPSSRIIILIHSPFTRPPTLPPSLSPSLPLFSPLHSPTLTCGGDPVDTRGGQVDLRVIKVGQLKIKPKLERKEGERGERESVTTTTTLSNQTSLTVLGRGNLFVQRCRLQNS